MARRGGSASPATTITPTGETASDVAKQLQSALVDCLGDPSGVLSVDLSGFEAIPSSVLALLLTANQELADGELAIRVSPQAFQSLRQWRLDSVLSLHESNETLDEQEVSGDGNPE